MSQTPVPITGGTGTSSIAAELVGGTSFQQVEIYGGGGASVLSINPDGTVNASIKGTVTITGSVQGTFTPSGNQSVSGTVGSSIIGTVPVTFVNSSISGTVNVSGLQGASVSGTVGASVIGTVPATQSGAWSASVVGGPITLYAPTASFVSGVTSVMTGTASVVLLQTAAGGQRNYITQVLVTNAAAVGTTVSLIDAGNVLYTGFAAASGGGFSASFPVPLRQSSITGSLGVVSSVQASVYVSANGFTAA